MNQKRGREKEGKRVDQCTFRKGSFPRNNIRKLRHLFNLSPVQKIAIEISGGADSTGAKHRGRE